MVCRDAKTYERANNVRVKKILSRVRSLQNLHCFVKKVSNVAILRFLVAFYENFEIFYYFWYFLALTGSLGPFTLFCRELDLS